MTVTDGTAGAISEPEHRIQLRRALSPARSERRSNGTISCSTAPSPGWFSPSCFFPASDPLIGTMQAYAIFFVGFIARPVGAAIFGHYGDRIGRKATLIATLLMTGLATFAVGLVPSYEQIGIWGAIIMIVLRFIQGVGVGGEWGGSVLMSMEWAQTNANRGFIASWPQFGGPAGLSWPISLCWLQRDLRRPVPDLGLAHPVPPQHHHGRRRALHPARHPRNPGVRRARRGRTARARALGGGIQAPAEGGHPDRIRADGRTSAGLCLYRLHFHLRHEVLGASRDFLLSRSIVAPRSRFHVGPDRRAFVGPHRPPAHVHDRRARSAACLGSFTSRCSTRCRRP